jgi:transcriptional regulator with XRE-family HTH domain
VRAKTILADVLREDGLVPLAALRLRKELSQAQLAERLGIHQPQLSRLESGIQEDVMLTTIVRLAEVLEVSVQEVYEAFKATRAARAKDLE